MITITFKYSGSSGTIFLKWYKKWGEEGETKEEKTIAGNSEKICNISLILHFKTT